MNSFQQNVSKFYKPTILLTREGFKRVGHSVSFSVDLFEYTNKGSQKNKSLNFGTPLTPPGFHRLNEPPERFSALWINDNLTPISSFTLQLQWGNQPKI